MLKPNLMRIASSHQPVPTRKRPRRRRTGLALQVLAIASSAVGLVLFTANQAAISAEPTVTPGSVAPIPVKVLVINMFGPEAQPWLKALQPTLAVRVPGLAADYPSVQCTGGGICQMTTGMGHANAAASMMAVLYSGLFDLHQTYFLVAGIAGIDPARGTLGSAAWAHYAVDFGIAHEIDAREIPSGWAEGYFGVGTDSPSEVPKLEYQTEVFELNPVLLQKALELSGSAQLEDAEDMRSYRQHYQNAPANQPPTVIQCDTSTADTWWTGTRLGTHARSWTKLLTAGKGTYCTSQQEDNATLEALTRAASSGLVDLQRVAVLRTGSDFDRPYAHQSAMAALRSQRLLPNAFPVATRNLVHAGMPLVLDIVDRWDLWKTGVPVSAAR
jgi:purine nucleoside permease